MRLLFFAFACLFSNPDFAQHWTAAALGCDTVFFKKCLAESAKLDGEKKFAEALQHLETGIESLKKCGAAQSVEMGEALHLAGRLCYPLNDWTRSVAFYQDAVDVRRVVLPKNHLDLGKSLNNLGGILNILGRFDESLRAREESLEIKLAQNPPDFLSIGKSYNGLGVEKMSRNDFDGAAIFFEKARDAYLKGAPATNYEQNVYFTKMGFLEFFRGNFEKSLKYYLDSYHFLSNNKYDIQPGIYNSIASCYEYLEDWANGLHWLELGLADAQISKQAGTQEFLEMRGKIMMQYVERGDCQTARHHANLALSEMNRAIVPGNPICASVWRSIAGVCVYEKNFGEAEKCYQNASEVWKQAQPGERETTKNRDHIEALTADFGNFYLQISDFKKAIAWYESIENQLSPEAWVGLAVANFAESKFEKTLVALDSAAAERKKRGQTFGVADFKIAADRDKVFAKFAKIEPEKQQKNIQISLQFAREALAFFDSLKTTAHSDEVLETNVARAFPIFFELLSSLHDLQKLAPTPETDALAFQILEKIRAQQLLAAVRAANSEAKNLLPDDWKKRSTELSEKYYHHLLREQNLEQNGIPENHREWLENAQKLAVAKKELLDFQQKTKTQFPKYHQITRSTESVELLDFQQNTLPPGHTFLTFAWHAPGDLLGMAINRTDSRIVLFENADQIAADVKKMRQAITEPETDAATAQKNRADFVAASRNLYQKIVEPFADFLSDSVIISEHGALDGLPWAALLDADPPDPSDYSTFPFWAKRKVISQTFSANYLAERKREPSFFQKKSVLAFAPFAKESGDFSEMRSAVGDSLAQKNLKPLRFSGSEAKAAVRALGGKALLGERATFQNFLKWKDQFSILLFASHAQSDDRRGDFSWLAFASPAVGSDNLAFAKDIYPLDLKADLVVLSACETALGQEKTGEGTLGLARAFAFAGADDVVASLWRINDQRTASFYAKFFEKLKNGGSTAQALTFAQRQFLRENPDDAHPFFWAGIVLVGK